MVYSVQRQKKKKRRRTYLKRQVKIIDSLLDDLLKETNKYTHYTLLLMDKYYFTKRLNSYFNEYYKYIKSAKNQLLMSSSSFDNLKRLNKK